MNQPPIRWLLLALAASPALIPLVIILKFGVNMPYWDEWSPNLVGLFIKAHAHQLTLWDLTAQHNEHRILVPRLIYLLIGLVTGGNTIAVMIAIWVAVCLTSAGILYVATKTSRGPGDNFPAFLSPSVLVPYFLANLLLFTPAQWENWLWSMGLANVLSVMFIVFATCAACSGLRILPKVSITIALALLATFSAANGLLVWPIVGVILAGSSSRDELRSKLAPLSAWVAAFVVAMALYSYGYKLPEHSSADNAGVAPLEKMAVYVLAFLGNPFSFGDAIPETAAAVTIGTIILLLLIVVTVFLLKLSEPRRAHFIVWLGVACIAVGSAFMAAPFRAGAGLGQALSSRYATFSIYALIALIFMIPMMLNDLSNRIADHTPGASVIFRSIGLVAMAIFLALYAVGLQPMWQTCRMARLTRAQGKAVLLLSNALPDNPQFTTLVGPDVPLILKFMDGIERAGYFHPKRLETANAQTIESTDPPGSPARGKILEAQQNGGLVRVSGYAIDPARGCPADAVFLTFDNAQGQPIVFVMADMGVARPELAAELKLSSANCGWTVTFPAGRIPPIAAAVQIRAWTMDIATGNAFRIPDSFSFGR